MIKNEKQYQNAQKHLKELNESRLKYEHKYQQGEERAFLGLTNTDSMIAKFQQQITEYENLQNGKQTIVHLDHFGELPELLIKARIAKNWSQADLAEKVGLKEQQIQRYESTDYASASTWKLLFILDALDVRTDVIQAHVGKAIFDFDEDEQTVMQAQENIMMRKSLLLAS